MIWFVAQQAPGAPQRPPCSAQSHTGTHPGWHPPCSPPTAFVPDLKAPNTATQRGRRMSVVWLCTHRHPGQRLGGRFRSPEEPYSLEGPNPSHQLHNPTPTPPITSPLPALQLPNIPNPTFPRLLPPAQGGVPLMEKQHTPAKPAPPPPHHQDTGTGSALCVKLLRAPAVNPGEPHRKR